MDVSSGKVIIASSAGSAQKQFTTEAQRHRGRKNREDQEKWIYLQREGMS